MSGPEREVADLLRKLIQAHERSADATSAQILAQLTGTCGRARDPRSLHRHYAQVYSQHGEDGYLAEIFARIGTQSLFFVEIGAGNGLENTTRLLLEQGWSGLWIEGNVQRADAIREIFRDSLAGGQLRVHQGLVTAENIAQILDQEVGDQAIDLLTIDVDYNTSHVWRAINRKARVCCIEYNASIPPTMALEVEYDAEAAWDGSNYFGAGLKALELIGHGKDMALVGCDVQGVNAFFVDKREDLDAFHAPFTAEFHFECARYFLTRRIGHPASKAARRWLKTEIESG